MPRATRSTSAPVRPTAARPAARPASASTSRRTAATSWTKLADAASVIRTYPCATPGKDAFLGRGINEIVIDPNEREPHLRRVRAGRSRPLARDRKRRHDAARAECEPARPLRVDRRRRHVHEVWNGQADARRCLRRHRCRARSAQPERPSTRPRSTRASGGAIAARRADRASARSSAPFFQGGGIDRLMFARDGEERPDAAST